MEYNPEKHGKVHLHCAWRGTCRNCGWTLEATDVCVGDDTPPAFVPCPQCLMQGKWSSVRVVRS